MQPLRYGINVTLDGCVDHQGVTPAEDWFRFWTDELARGSALLYGRVTYQMMEEGWRHSPPPGARPEWMEPFPLVMGPMKKYVVSSTLTHVDWNAELVRGDLKAAVQTLKAQPGNGLLTGGVKLPLALAELGLIDEFIVVVHPTIAGHGPTLFAGLSKVVDLKLVGRQEFGSGAMALRYEPKR